MSVRTTRLAPSPTGALHLGNARTFLINWALAKQNEWRIVLRIEDLDTPRVKVEAQRQAIEDLRWLGIDWDEGPHYQMSDLAPYRYAISKLHKKGLVYACSCSRSEIAAAQSAPNLGDHEPRYPGTCRISPSSLQCATGEDRVQQYLDRWRASTGEPAGESISLRLVIPDEPIEFDDVIHGRQSINVQQQIGDIVIATKAHLPAYQLAVVVDDARQAVTDIVRGDDLIPSAARQFWLYRFLDLTPLPRYWHLPLVVGEDGRRLAKRHGDTRLAWYRSQGVPAERIIGWIASTCGFPGDPVPLSAVEFAQQFDWKTLSRKPIVFAGNDHAWLMSATR